MSEKNQKYWNNLLKEYQSGSISESHRFELEKQALDDPFLFDALEGFSGNQSMDQARTSGRLFSLRNIAAAASIILLVTISVVLSKNGNEPVIKSNDTYAQVLESKDALKENDIVGKVNDDEEETEMNKGDSVQKSIEKTGQKLTKSSDEKNPILSKSSRNASEEYASEEKNIVKPAKKDVIETAKPIDQPNDNIENNTSVSIPSSAMAVEDHQNENDFDAAALETANEIGKKRRKKGPSIYVDAVPLIGKKTFDEFTAEKINSRGLRQKDKTIIKIEFIIDKAGSLSNFRQLPSSCPECSAYAISLLQNSGEWKTDPEGFVGKAVYAFEF